MEQRYSLIILFSTLLILLQYRYVVFHIEFKRGSQRKFDVHGKEVEPNFGQTGLVRTGYLQSTYSKDC